MIGQAVGLAEPEERVNGHEVGPVPSVSGKSLSQATWASIAWIPKTKKPMANGWRTPGDSAGGDSPGWPER